MIHKPLLLFILFSVSQSVPDEFRGSLGTNLDLIWDNIFVGNQHAAMEVDILIQEYNISFILNVAWDLDLHYPLSNYVGDVSDGNEHLLIQYSKVGLVDGSGNQAATLASAVYSLRQFREQRELLEKDRKVFPQQGNILVHCHSGQSRSVLTTALYVCFEYPQIFKSLDQAVDYIKERRRLSNHPSVPEPHLLSLAQKLVELPLFQLFPSSPSDQQ